MDARHLEQAPAPADARDVGPFVRRRGGDAVRGERQVEQRCDVREDLVPALRPRPEDRCGGEGACALGERLRDRPRRVRAERVALCDVQRLDTVAREGRSRTLC